MNKVRISTDLENIKKYQTEFIKQKNKITELINSVGGFIIRLNQAEEGISKLEDRGKNIEKESK